MPHHLDSDGLDGYLAQDLQLGQVINSALMAIGDEDHFPKDKSLPYPGAFEFPSARSAIVILVDGLGWHLLEKRRGHASTLRSEFSNAQTLSAPLPSTTASSTALFCTGASPARTNMVGYSVFYGNQVVNLLQFAEGIDCSKWQPEPTYFQMANPDIRCAVVTDKRFAGTGMTGAVLRGAEFYGVDALDQRFEMAIKLANEKPSLVYLYWSKIDHAGHKYGPSSPQWTEQLEYFDSELGYFLRRLPANVLAVLSADHGMVDTGQKIDIAAHPQLHQDVGAIAGEGRAVQVHAEPGKSEEVLTRWKQFFEGEETVVVPKAFLPRIFGQGSGTELLGDGVVFSGGQQVIVDSRTQSAASIAQRGVHGSFSPLERDVPLFVFRN